MWKFKFNMPPLKGFLLSFLLSLLLLQNVESARILAIIPIASYSHQMFYQQIWRELALRGHDMVVVTTDPTGEQLPNFKEINVSETYIPTKEMINASIKESMFKLFLTNRMMDLDENIALFQMNLPQMQELIHNKSEHFDLILAEAFPSMHMAFKHKYNCPLISVMSIDAFSASHQIMGNPTHTVMYPISILPFQENMNLFERTAVFLFEVVMQLSQTRNMEKLNELTREVFGEDVPDVFELMKESDMLFVNANPLFSATRPHTPSTINLAGGVHMKKPKPLPKDLKDFLDSGKDGVIYFSLGSNVKSKELSLELRETLLKTLSELPYKILWKFEDDTLPGKPKNVKITKWAPQQDVLRHPNVKLFITQGGIQSLEEALYSHVPMVVLPFMGDQEANAARVKSKQIGVMLNPHKLTVEDFKAAILEVMENKIYRDNVKRLADQIQDQPMTPLERAIWWTEYVLRHKGAQHLKGPTIPLYQYYYFDVFVFLGVILLLLLAVFVGIIKLLLKGLRKLTGCDKSKKLKKS
ncbi:LOW QUALITY PROTEIN: UDP-glycosyltransferase UGT5-like [Atheta coriaria]|uniref:LOW QUALITY PROTEIN: UDP-glycosyltransferase UGT5-like n=1 Tax=Dalotia coriaria TaxID=877792 RepID=UPI0031F3F456